MIDGVLFVGEMVTNRALELFVGEAIEFLGGSHSFLVTGFYLTPNSQMSLGDF